MKQLFLALSLFVAFSCNAQQPTASFPSSVYTASNLSRSVCFIKIDDKQYINAFQISSIQPWQHGYVYIFFGDPGSFIAINTGEYNEEKYIAQLFDVINKNCK